MLSNGGQALAAPRRDSSSEEGGREHAARGRRRDVSRLVTGEHVAGRSSGVVREQRGADEPSQRATVRCEDQHRDSGSLHDREHGAEAGGNAKTVEVLAAVLRRKLRHRKINHLERGK